MLCETRMPCGLPGTSEGDEPDARQTCASAAPRTPSLLPAVWLCAHRFDGEWKDGKPIVKDAANQSPDFLAWLNDSVGAVAGPRRNREYQSVSQQDDD